MKVLSALVATYIVLVCSVLPHARVYASSEQAYTDYLYQFDIYRQKNTEFKIAKNEYDKFKTLTSQTAALEKSKEFLAARNQLLKAYLFVLNEKLNEDAGLVPTIKNLYQTLIRNEVAFLEQHSELVTAVGSLQDAENVSKQLSSHYTVLQASMRQTIIGVSLGQLAVVAKAFDESQRSARAFVIENRSLLPSQKQAVLDRWMIQIGNKRSLYAQKVETITLDNAKLKGRSIDELDRVFAKLQKDLIDARQYLAEGTSYLSELLMAMRYD